MTTPARDGLTDAEPVAYEDQQTLREMARDFVKGGGPQPHNVDALVERAYRLSRAEIVAENARLHHERAEDMDRMERAAETIERLRAATAPADGVRERTIEECANAVLHLKRDGKWAAGVDQRYRDGVADGFSMALVVIRALAPAGEPE